MRSVTESTPPTYRLTEEQMLLRDAVRTLADERVAPRAADIDRTGEFPQDLRELLAAQDILALPFPAAYGGLDADLLTVCLAVEQLSRACATTGLILAVHELASLPIVLAGTPEQQERWLPRLASGEHLIAFALTEAEAGLRRRRDPDARRPRRRRLRHHGLQAVHQPRLRRGSADGLRGHRPGPGRIAPHRLSCFVVEVPTPGFVVARIEHKMGLRGSPTAELAFDGVRVPAGEPDRRRGRRVRDRDADVRPEPARRSPPRPSGIAQGALEAATAYARDRRQFGQRIGDLQMVAAMLADMDAATESARQLLYKACVEIEAGAPDASRWAAMCKLVAGDAAMRVTTDAVQVLGGYGYIDEFPVERMMRDAKITQLYEGTQQIQRLVVARSLLGKGD